MVRAAGTGSGGVSAATRPLCGSAAVAAARALCGEWQLEAAGGSSAVARTAAARWGWCGSAAARTAAARRLGVSASLRLCGSVAARRRLGGGSATARRRLGGDSAAAQRRLDGSSAAARRLEACSPTQWGLVGGGRGCTWGGGAPSAGGASGRWRPRVRRAPGGCRRIGAWGGVTCG